MTFGLWMNLVHDAGLPPPPPPPPPPLHPIHHQAQAILQQVPTADLSLLTRAWNLHYGFN